MVMIHAAAPTMIDEVTKMDRTRLMRLQLHFHDTSKKGTRRWCRMRLCGNRMKVAAYAAWQRRRTLACYTRMTIFPVADFVPCSGAFPGLRRENIRANRGHGAFVLSTVGERTGITIEHLTTDGRPDLRRLLHVWNPLAVNVRGSEVEAVGVHSRPDCYFVRLPRARPRVRNGPHPTLPKAELRNT